MSQFKNYDPSKILVSFNGVQIQGYADGTFIKAARAEDAFKTSTGAGGDVVRVRNRNRTGMVTITLQYASLSNDALSNFLITDEQTGLGFGALTIKDLNGTTLLTASKAWVQKPADSEWSADMPNREWVLECADLAMFNGGAAV